MSRDDNDKARCAAASNATRGTKIALRLSADRAPWVRGLAVADACLPSDALPGALERGANGPDVLRNPGCQPHLFGALLARWDRRSEAAAHLATPAEILAEFTTITDCRVRATAASNPACPRAAVTRAAFDTAAQVRFAALKSPAARSAKPWLEPGGRREPPPGA